MGCGRSKSAETSSTPATITAGSHTNQKVLNLGNGQVFDIFEDDFDIKFAKRNVTNSDGSTGTNHILELYMNIQSSTPIASVTSSPKVKISKDGVVKYNHDIDLVYDSYKKKFEFDKFFYSDGAKITVIFTFSRYNITIEKTVGSVADLADGFTNYKKNFDIDGYSDENPLLGKVYSSFR
uniref:Uncharacterized protein n=1 Tax=viral metagenome TaxID=1070528 RepID=A0A6C0D6Q0_9ZZZZ